MTDAELEQRKALEVMLIIRSGLFDAHLEQILTACTDRMRDRAYRRPPPPVALDPSDPDSWPTSGLFAPRDGA